MSTNVSEYPELLRDLADQVRSQLQMRGIDDAIAHEVSLAAIDHVRSHFGGEMIYVPKALSLDARRRAAEIWAEFDGRNITELAKKYDMSMQHIYKVLRYMRAEQVLVNQRPLFEDEPPVKPNLR